jgi:bifunctional UDP-N-acetylglucosamine pyrophosphorylase/glucosamine-1-phosphate N-acetyltransferase
MDASYEFWIAHNNTGRLPKVLQTVGGRPMLQHVLNTAFQLAPSAVHVVYGDGAEQVQAVSEEDGIRWVHQARRLGTGHAVQQAMPGIPDDSHVLVLYGDHPLTPVEVLAELASASTDDLNVLTMALSDPTGYGRMVRDDNGAITGIVEHKDCTEAQRAIREVNTGMIMTGSGQLRRWLERLDCDNSQGEYYLTDIFAMAHNDGVPVHSVLAPDARDLQGANDRAQMVQLENRYRQNVTAGLMRDGVQITDPTRVEIRGDIHAGSDVLIDINVILEGRVELGDGVQIAAGSVLRDCSLAAGTRVHPHSVLEGVTTTGACDIGPFARLRPGTVLAQDSRVGNFVEIKNTSLGEGSKASHLTYLGDSEIGIGVNIGAGTITCNYDGANKFRTVIEDGAFIGSNTQLVAPVRVGKNANVGAGTTLTKDAPEGKLTVARARQATVPGWKRPKKKS